jgi:hypothetical protein
MKLKSINPALFPLVAALLFIHFQSFAAKSKTPAANKPAINTAYDDSLSLLNASVGDVFIVDAKQFVVYPDKNDLENKNFLEWKSDTLKSGDKFKIIDIQRLGVKYGALIRLPDSSMAYVVNLVTLPKYCYKEGTSPWNGRIERSLDSMIRFSHKEFWIILGVTLLISALFLIFSGMIDRSFYKWSGKKRKIVKPGIAFLVASALFGALTGLSILFYGSRFKDFVMHLPIFTYPAESVFIVKFYWSLQIFFLGFYGWAVYRGIREFGVKTGIVRSLIILIPAFAIFWTALATSFVVLVGALVLLFMSVMASDVGKGPQPSTMIKEEIGTFTGEKKTVQINYDAQGNQKSKKYI